MKGLYANVQVRTGLGKRKRTWNLLKIIEQPSPHQEARVKKICSTQNKDEENNKIFWKNTSFIKYNFTK